MKVTYTLICVSSIVLFTWFLANLISLACDKYKITAGVTQAVGKNACCDADSYRCVKEPCYRQHEEIYWKPLRTANRVRSSICVHYDPLMNKVYVIRLGHIFECLTLWWSIWIYIICRLLFEDFDVATDLLILQFVIKILCQQGQRDPQPMALRILREL
mgnify:CR=1 FL=1